MDQHHTVPAVAPDRTVNPNIYASPPGNDAFPVVTVWVEPFRAGAAVQDVAWCTSTVQPYASGDFTGQRGLGHGATAACCTSTSSPVRRAAVHRDRELRL